MKLSAAFGPLADLSYALRLALKPTLIELYHNPGLVLRPSALSRIFMAHVWVGFGPGTDTGARDAKLTLISPNASGVVLDIGAGKFIISTL